MDRTGEFPSMSRARRWLAVASAVLALLPAATVRAQQSPPKPFAPDWAMFAGWDVFTKKSCGQCHSVRGVGGKVGPDLARSGSGNGFYELGAAMWNHLPKMGARMREQGIEGPRLTATDVSNLLAFLFTAAYREESGDATSGEQLFTAKGCVQCHSVGGKGGNVGPALDVLKAANSPVLVAAAMWNHGPRMAEAMKAKGIERPTFKDRELGDIVAYVVGPARDGDPTTAQVIPGTPERGQSRLEVKTGADGGALADIVRIIESTSTRISSVMTLAEAGGGREIVILMPTVNPLPAVHALAVKGYS